MSKLGYTPQEEVFSEREIVYRKIVTVELRVVQYVKGN